MDKATLHSVSRRRLLGGAAAMAGLSPLRAMAAEIGSTARLTRIAGARRERPAGCSKSVRQQV